MRELSAILPKLHTTIITPNHPPPHLAVNTLPTSTYPLLSVEGPSFTYISHHLIDFDVDIPPSDRAINAAVSIFPSLLS